MATATILTLFSGPMKTIELTLPAALVAHIDRMARAREVAFSRSLVIACMLANDPRFAGWRDGDEGQVSSEIVDLVFPVR